MSEVVVEKRSEGLALASMIVGICAVVIIPLGFPLGVTAIILGIIALKKQQRKAFAVTGLATGIAGLLFSVAVIASIAFAAFNGIESRATDSSVRADASAVIRQAKTINTAKGEYPDFETYFAVLESTGITISKHNVGEQGDIIYVPCNGVGAVVLYWSIDDDMYKQLKTGNTLNCEWND